MEKYNGTKVIEMDDEQLSQFFTDPYDNSTIGCLLNQYLIIKSNGDDGAMTGPYLWTGEEFKTVRRRTFISKQFGDITAKGDDPFQIAYMDSIYRNQLTFATGPAGTGKSLIAMAYAFEQLERGRVSKIVIFVNPYIAQSAVKLGFMPGEKVDKLLETSIGSILISKIGDEDHVRDLIRDGSIVLMPLGDCRGYEVPEDAFVYFTEAQNTNTYLMKLFLQRTNDRCKICIEGDIDQTDSIAFAEDNGLSRSISVFRGEDYASHVELQTIYRGRIAKKAQEM